MSDTPTTPPAEPTCPNCQQPGNHWKLHPFRPRTRGGDRQGFYTCNPQPRKEGDEPCEKKKEGLNTTTDHLASPAEQSSDPTVIGETLSKSATPETLEPKGGNFYRPHPFQITSGEFWRCAHGNTGMAGLFNPVGCFECACERIEQLETERDSARAERDELLERLKDNVDALRALTGASELETPHALEQS